MDTEHVISRAQTLLSDTLGQSVTLQPQPALKSNHLVLRCGVAGSPTLNSVIIKQLRLDDVPEARHSWYQQRFFNEWASLQFINTLPGAFSARWMAGDSDARMLIVEDLGDHPSIQDLLFSHDTSSARLALTAYARTLGQLQAASIGHESHFRELRSALGAVTPLSDGNIDVRKLLPALHEFCAALNIIPVAGFDDEVLAVGAAIHGDSPFRALCHCDAGMHNVLWRDDGQVRLVDFEFAQYQHALVDIVCARMTYPPAYHGRALPLALVREIENAYRAELANVLPAAADDALFEAALMHACAHWVLSEVGGTWEPYFKPRLQQDAAYDTQNGHTNESTTYFRSRMFSYLEAFVASADEFRQLPALRTTLAQVYAGLKRHWPDSESTPYFPAFVEVHK
ncbi:MAG: phosphotransferase [Anaerolineae bacterium]